MDDARSILHDADTQWGLLPCGGAYKDYHDGGLGRGRYRARGLGFQTHLSADYDDSDHSFYSI